MATSGNGPVPSTGIHTMVVRKAAVARNPVLINIHSAEAHGVVGQGVCARRIGMSFMGDTDRRRWTVTGGSALPVTEFFHSLPLG